MNILAFLSILLPLSSSWLAKELFTFLYGSYLNFYEIIGSSFPVGILITYIVTYLEVSIIGINKIQFLVLTTFCLGFAIFLFRININRPKPYRPRFTKTTFIFLSLCFLFFSYLSFKAIFPKEGQFIITGENDSQHEFALIASLLNGANKYFSLTGITCPLFPSEKIFSETIPSIYEAILCAAGCPIKYSCLIVTNGFFFSALLLQFCFTYRLFSSQYAAALSSPLIFLISGFGFINYLSDGHSTSQCDFVFYLSPNNVIQWGHPLLHCYLTSRAALMSLPLSIFALICRETGLFIPTTFLLFFTSIVRKQSGIVLGFILSLYTSTSFYNNPFIIFLKKIFSFLTNSNNNQDFNNTNNADNNININIDNNKIKFDKNNIFMQLIIILLTIIIFYFNKKDISYEPSMPLYLKEQQRKILPLIQFPLQVFGFVCFMLPFIFLSKNHIFQLFDVIICFYIFNFISLQPNIRFNFFSILTSIVPLIAALSCGGFFKFASIWRSTELSGIIETIFAFLVMFSCVSSLAGLWQRRNQLLRVWGQEEKIVSKWIMSHTSKKSNFATLTQDFWNPALVLAGRNQLTTTPWVLQFFSFNFSLPDQALWEWTFSDKNNFIIHPDYIIQNVILKPDWSDALNDKVHKKQLTIVYSSEKYRIFQWKL